MGIIVDIILIICLITFIMAGYKRGLTGSLLKLVSFAIAVVLAILLYKPLANFVVEKTDIDENIKTSIVNMFSKNEGNNKEANNEQGLQNTIINNINQNIENATTEAKNTIVEQSAVKMSVTIINVGCAIIIFILAKILLIFVKLFMKGITSLPVIKQVDKFGGIIFGIAEGLLIIYIALGIISFSAILWPNNKIAYSVEKSAIGSKMYNNNVVVQTLIK